MGKIIGGGLPVGAVGGRAELMTELFNPRTRTPKLGLGGTFNANPMTMADRSIGERSNGFFRFMLNEGVYMASQGFMVLSTAMDEADIDFILDKSLRALRSLAKSAA